VCDFIVFQEKLALRTKKLRRKKWAKFKKVTGSQENKSLVWVRGFPPWRQEQRRRQDGARTWLVI
jgi:hypothetical protein